MKNLTWSAEIKFRIGLSNAELHQQLLIHLLHYLESVSRSSDHIPNGSVWETPSSTMVTKLE